MKAVINFNGQLLPAESAFLNHENRGIKYGDCLFETIRATGNGIFFLEDHYLRLMSSMRILRMEIPMDFTMEFIKGQIEEVLQANHLREEPARVRFTVFRKNGGRYLPAGNDVSYIIECHSLNSPYYTFGENPYEVELFKDFYVNEDMLSNLKTNNRAINIVGSIYAGENGYDNCLLLNQSKHVVEALNANLFVVLNEQIKTAPLKDGCINGIIRKKLIEIIKKKNNYTLKEESISPFELQKADEMFITNIICGVQPITKYRKAQYGNSVSSSLLESLNIMVKELS